MGAPIVIVFAPLLDLNNGNVELADFDLSETKTSLNNDPNAREELKGTPEFMSPELLERYKQHSAPFPNFEAAKQADDWAVGMTLYYMLTENIHLNQVSLCQSYAWLIPEMKGITDEAINSQSQKIPKDLQRIIEGLIEPNPEKRMTVEEALKHLKGTQTGSRCLMPV